jgi:hypothetical protein
MSLKERKKQWQSSGKGHTKLLEIANPLEQARVATKAVQRRVSENRGTNVVHVQHVILTSVSELAEKSITATNPVQKPTTTQFFNTWSQTLRQIDRL